MARAVICFKTSTMAAAVSVMLAADAVAAITPNPGVFEAREGSVTIANEPVRVTLVKPVALGAPPYLVLFASGDGGLRGISKAVLQHLADRGYAVVGFSSPDALKRVTSKSAKQLNYRASLDALGVLIAHAKRDLALPDRTQTIVTGMSRGANVVVASAGDPGLKSGIAGAVAIALTREFDNLTIPDEAKSPPGVETDEKGRLQTYPAIERLGTMPLAVIQSTNDGYVTSAESRRLLGPDTPTRRLYEVPSRNHSFAGGEAMLMRDLDDAMAWITGAAGRSGPK